MTRSDDKHNVLVKIVSQQTSDVGDDTSEVITTGLLTLLDDGAFRLEYDEILGEDSAKMTCRSKITAGNDGVILFERFGPYMTRMLFEPDKRYTSAYITPYGELSFGIYTKTAIAERDALAAAIRLEYTIDNGGELISKNAMTIKTKKRKTVAD
ncbi:MAG: DUF1934 domain-containing protein [Clostridia bacterium]|nr:DUF1934 domain-containing protein [Clostridia bacterium]